MFKSSSEKQSQTLSKGLGSGGKMTFMKIVHLNGNDRESVYYE